MTGAVKLTSYSIRKLRAFDRLGVDTPLAGAGGNADRRFLTQMNEKLAAALQDVADNDGVMWRASHWFEAKRLWDELEREGLVEFNPWSGRYQPSPAGRAALEQKP